MADVRQRASGCLFGLAFGDALAADTEFLNVEQILRRAAVTRGDSDSIACLTGAFAGASHGLSVWPADWIAQIEYRERLASLSEAWDK